jgi:hypothetical protein
MPFLDENGELNGLTTRDIKKMVLFQIINPASDSLREREESSR